MKILRFIGLTLLVYTVLNLPIGVIADLLSSSASLMQAIRAVLFITAIIVVAKVGHKLPWKKLLVVLVLEIILIIGIVYFVNGNSATDSQPSATLSRYNALQSQLEAESKDIVQCYEKQGIDESAIKLVFTQMKFAGKEIPEARQNKITAEILNEISNECDEKIADYEVTYAEWLPLHKEATGVENVFEYSIDFSPSNLRLSSIGTDLELAEGLVNQKL